MQSRINFQDVPTRLFEQTIEVLLSLLLTLDTAHSLDDKSIK